MSGKKADFYSGARKILRNRSFSFDAFAPGLELHHAGYTKMKRRALMKLYYTEKEIETAAMLWERRVGQDKYGSVGFHLYGHLIKNDPEKKSKRASVMGPCIQAISVTYMPDRTAAVDCFYRTTELFKKFPADLVFLRDDVMTNFDFTKAPVSEVNFHFANITCHPMYFAVMLPWMEDPVAALDKLRAQDKYFYDWVIKWTGRYLCDEHKRGIQKFAQAMRVHDEVREDLEEAGTLEMLADYMRDNHPGYRKDYIPPEAEDDDVS